MSNAAVQEAMFSLGATKRSQTSMFADGLKFCQLADALGFSDADLHQRSGAGVDDADLGLIISDWTFVIQPSDANVTHLSMQDTVIFRADLRVPALVS